ncbi:MAG: ATP-binding protein, partial [Anaerolineales bacterium]
WLFSQSGRYTNMPGGTYKLKLKGSNNDSVWNEAGTSIEVIVVPPIWETLWFQGVLVLILVAAGYGAYRLRVRGLNARSHELERQVENRTAELTDANIHLYQEIEEREQAEEELAQQSSEAAVVEERNRLARDLHDSVTQSIYSLTLLSEAGQRMTEARDMEQLTMNQSRIGDISQQVLQEMRLLVYELRPPALETERLVGALEHRLELVERRAGIEARLIVEGEPDLPADLEVELYRIGQEALNNALKHAQASTVSVVFRVDAGSISLQIQDDGRGFEPETAQASGGFGLTTMAERAEKLGGRLTIRSSPDEGTIVKVEVHR